MSQEEGERPIVGYACIIVPGEPGGEPGLILQIPLVEDDEGQEAAPQEEPHAPT